MGSNFERLQKIINQAYAENFSCLFHVKPRNLPRSPYLWPRWSSPLDLNWKKLRIQGCIENKKCSPEKVSITKYLQIDTLHTQKLEFIHLELACPSKSRIFGKCKNIEGFNFKKKKHVKKSTFFNFFSISQLIRIVLQLNFSEMVLNMQVYLHKNSKILIPCEKKNRGKKILFLVNSWFRLNKNLNYLNYRKNPSKWWICTTKMIEKWAPFANSCQTVKVLKKRIIVHCAVLS